MKRFIIIALILFSLLSCSMPEEFKGVQWDTKITVPLMDESFFASDLETTDNISIIDEQLVMTFDSDLDNSYTIDTQMKIDSKSSPTIPLVANESITGALSIDESAGANEDNGDIDVVSARVADISDVLQIDIDATDNLESLTILFHNILDPNEEAITLEITEFDNITEYDLTHHFLGDSDNETILDSLTFTILATPIEDQPNPLLGSFRVFFEGHLYMDQFNGFVYNKMIEVEDETTEVDIDYPADIDESVEVGEVSLEFNIENSMGFDVEFYGKITAFNENSGEQTSIYIDELDNLSFDPAIDEFTPTTSVRTLSDSVSNLLNIFPTEIIVTNARFVVGTDIDNYEQGFANEGSGASGTIDAEVPFQFRIISNEPVTPDSILSVEISQDNQDLIEDYLESAGLVLTLENTYPLGGIVDIFFDTTEEDVYNLDSGFQILGNTVNAGTESITEITSSILDIGLTSEQLNLFTSDKVYYGFKMKFDSTGDSFVEIKPKDNIRVFGRIETEVNVDIEGN